MTGHHLKCPPFPQSPLRGMEGWQRERERATALEDWKCPGLVKLSHFPFCGWHNRRARKGAALGLSLQATGVPCPPPRLRSIHELAAKGKCWACRGNFHQFPVMQPLFAATPCPGDCRALRVYMGRPHTRLEGALALHWIPPCWRLTTEAHIRGPCS